MDWTAAFCGAVLHFAAVYGAEKYIERQAPDSNKTFKWQIVSAALAAFVGFFSTALLALRVGTYLPNLLRLMLLGALLAAAVCTDLAVHRIPNWICLLIIMDFTLCTALDFALSGTAALDMMMNGLISAAVFLIVFLLLRFVSHKGIGYGDIKLISASASVLGIYGGFSFLLFSHVIAALVAIVLLVTKKATRKDGIPFGPFFYLGYFITIALGSF